MSKELSIKLDIKEGDRKDYLRKYIDIYSALGVNESYWLAPREKEFFINCILLQMEGYNLASFAVIEPLSKALNFQGKSRGVYIYRNRLKEKGWLDQTRVGLSVIKPFQLASLPNIRLSIKLEYSEIARQDSSSGTEFPRERDTGSPIPDPYAEG